MKKILLTLVVLTTLLISTSYAQMPWQYTVTGLNHTVLVQASTSITINGTALTSGDYIGMFYDSLGTLACGGYLEYTGGTGAAAAWANDANSTDIDGLLITKNLNGRYGAPLMVWFLMLLQHILPQDYQIKVTFL